MNQRKASRSNPRRRGPKRPQPGVADSWLLPVAELPAVEPIVMPGDVGAMLRSLGDPPMRTGVAAAGYFTTVVERAAGVALALAFSADLVAPADADG